MSVNLAEFFFHIAGNVLFITAFYICYCKCRKQKTNYVPGKGGTKAFELAASDEGRLLFKVH